MRGSGWELQSARCTAATGLIVILSCAGHQRSPREQPASSTRDSADTLTVEVTLPFGLRETVTIRPAQLISGQTIEIRSVIRNKADSAVTAQSRICGLTLAGSLELSIPPGTGGCGGFSVTRPLAPADSLVMDDIEIVRSPPGHYTLQVLHLLGPQGVWIVMPLTVTAPRNSSAR